ncbi:thiol:disulfide interchange protein DsbA/DsbL [Shewanella schlegeliana]|uniref:Thiol:disulfide interchange protein n=1 Tax=Shewanella schlegeliana TaxID=190308 RepID=A0ABS1SWA4_9GAMM|nr:thiol:disulfide interchange protein DsbA/DsbL [Shewanella schlegeliana]MBL4912669.1 thiol:disulfide interchange protein DsbA/DsbL [Shewanella schlegeliana]MCL1109821.1 thiol:disulfide interchange protein DsbA/DsbL [Shewanella schlegeliana]GIU30156.1 thiol:disulfide interchange protein [Shewanella schlegeliana]
MIKHIALALTLAVAPMSSFAAQFIEGKHFTVVSDKAPSSEPKLTEFYSFYCGNCFNMEKMYLADIKANLNKQITFDSKHVDFANTDINTEVMRSLAVIQTLDNKQPLTDAMFKVIQGDNGEKHDHSAPGHKHEEPLKSRDDIKAVFAKFGVDSAQYDKIADSAETDSKLALWRKQQREFRVQSVPAFIVNDKYAINMGSIRTLGELIDLMNYLAIEHK